MEGGSRERECGPGGDYSCAKDGGGLDDISNSLTLGEFCQLDCAFGLVFLFQFIPLSFEVVKVVSACLTERFDQSYGGEVYGIGGKITIWVSWVMALTASRASF